MQKSSLLYTTNTPILIYKHKHKSGMRYRRQNVHPQPQTGESVAKPGTPLLIICSSVCKSYIKEVHDNLSNPCSKRKTRDGNILGRWINAETVPKTFIIPHKVNTVNIGYWTTSSWKGRLPYAISSNQSCHKWQPILWNIATYWALCYSSCW